MCAASPKHILNLLSPGPGLLGTIINQIQLLQQLSQALQSHLPDPLQRHCTVAAVNQTTLVIHADSPAWATRLRYLAPTLAASLRDQSGYPWIRDIKVKVRPNSLAEPAEPRREEAGQGREATGRAAGHAAPGDLRQVLQGIVADKIAKGGPKP